MINIIAGAVMIFGSYNSGFVKQVSPVFPTKPQCEQAIVNHVDYFRRQYFSCKVIWKSVPDSWLRKHGYKSYAQYMEKQGYVQEPDEGWVPKKYKKFFDQQRKYRQEVNPYLNKQ